jgi:hypothetical protein
MKFSANSRKSDPIPAGVYRGRCIGVVDLGVQAGSGRFGPRAEIWLAFELPTVRLQTKDGDVARMISHRFKQSMHAKSALRKLIESWLGSFRNDDAAADFDVKGLLDRPCLVNVKHALGADGNVYANLETVAPLMVDMDPEDFPRERPLMFYDLAEPDDKALALLPEWLREVIKERMATPEPAQAPEAPIAAVAAAEGDLDDAIPF